MVRERLKTYGRKRNRQASDDLTDNDQPRSDTPPPDATVSLEDMARKMRRRAEGAHRNSGPRKSFNAATKLGSPAHVPEPAPKRPKLMRNDELTSDGPILAGLSPPPSRKFPRHPMTSTRTAKENKHRRSLKSSLGSSTSAFNFPPAQPQRLASPVRLGSFDLVPTGPSRSRRPLSNVTRRSFAISNTNARNTSSSDKRRPSAAEPSTSRTKHASEFPRKISQLQRKRQSNGWLLSSPSKRGLFDDPDGLPFVPPKGKANLDTADERGNTFSFMTGSPTAFSTPKKTKDSKQGAPVQQPVEDNDPGSDMEIDNDSWRVPVASPAAEPSFLHHSTALQSSRLTHASANSSFPMSASVSKIHPGNFDRGSRRHSRSSVHFTSPQAMAPIPLKSQTQSPPPATPPTRSKSKAKHQARDDPAVLGLPSPATSPGDGDELRDLFSVMGLDGSWFLSSSLSCLHRSLPSSPHQLGVVKFDEPWLLTEDECWARSDSSLNMFNRLSVNAKKRALERRGIVKQKARTAWWEQGRHSVADSWVPGAVADD